MKLKRLYQRLMGQTSHSQPPTYITVVSGLPRSGTSMMMQMLTAGGLEALADNKRIADENNPRGYLELDAVKQLSAGNIDWIPGAQGKVVKVVSPLLRYLPDNYTYRIVLMRRNLEDVMASQQRMMDNLNTSNPNSSNMSTSVQNDSGDLLDKYQQHLNIVQRNLTALEHTQLLVLDYDDVLQQPKDTAQALTTFLNQPLDIRRMTKAVEPDLKTIKT